MAAAAGTTTLPSRQASTLVPGPPITAAAKTTAHGGDEDGKPKDTSVDEDEWAAFEADVAAASYSVELSDGSTNKIPLGTPDQMLDAWRNHYRLVTRHLHRGIRQGWDLHPNQLVTRLIATYAYFRRDWEESAQRLSAYLAGDASRWMDEPATAKMLADFLARALDCGAITPAELAPYAIDTDLFPQLRTNGRLT